MNRTLLLERLLRAAVVAAVAVCLRLLDVPMAVALAVLIVFAALAILEEEA